LICSNYLVLSQWASQKVGMLVMKKSWRRVEPSSNGLA
jgi:hypothetical protein